MQIVFGDLDNKAFIAQFLEKRHFWTAPKKWMIEKKIFFAH